MIPLMFFYLKIFARRGGVEVAGWTLERTTRVQFPAYPHGVWISDCKEVKDVFGCPGERAGVGSAH